MKFAKLVATIVMLACCSCSGIPLIGDLSPQAAKRQAKRDFESGHPKLYEAGGYAVSTPGIGEKDKALVAKLPRDGSLAGCTNPKVQYSKGYATAYNQEMIHLLRNGRLSR